MQQEVVGMLLDNEELPKAAEIRDLVERWRHRILKGDLSFDEIVISQSLSKALHEYDDPGPPHVRVARILKERGEAIGDGARVSYLVVGTKGGLQVVPASDPGAFEKIDRAYYWEKRIYPATGRILEAVYEGAAWGESMEIRKQRVLELRGQETLDFAGGVPRPRRRTKSGGGVIVTLVEQNQAEDGAAEKHRRRLFLEAVRAAIEAHPGDSPVTVRVEFWSPYDDREKRIKVDLPTGLGIARTYDARRALDRIVTAPNRIEGLPVRG
jgi:hypothetical protein